MPRNSVISRLMSLELEEKILNGGSLMAFICIFFPWIGGEWLGGTQVAFSGLGFFTSFIGLTVLLLHLFILLITLVPLTGGPIFIRKKSRDTVRLVCAVFAAVLTIATWSVLTKFTFEFSRLEIHFGLYGTLIGSFISALYSYLKLQDSKKSVVEDLFHQNTAQHTPHHRPPPPDHPENHRIHHQ